MGNFGSKRIRETLLPEAYPFQGTLDMMTHVDEFMEYCFVLLDYAMEHWKKRTVTLIVWPLPVYVFTNDVENITHILKTNFQNYPKGPEMKMRFQDLLGNGIFNSDDDQWLFHRKTSANLFNLNRFRGAILSTFNEHCDIVVRILQGSIGRPFDIQKIMHQFTLDSIGKIAFGEDLHSLERTVTFADDFDYCQNFANDSFVNPAWKLKRYFTPMGWYYYFRLWRLNRFVYSMVAERRREVIDPTKEKRNDLVTMYLDRQEAYDRQLTDDDLRDIILNFLIAGRDTTAQALSWAFYRLSINPDIQAAARSEVLNIIEQNGAISFETLQEMKYLEAVCMETLRLHPSVPKEAKYVREDDILPDGTHVYKGDTVVFFPWIMGRSEELWENAHTFNPHRFMGNGSKPSPFVFSAFQAGPRMCLGQSLALLEMKCCLARLLSKFSFKLEQDEKSVTYLNSLTLPIKGGLRVSVTQLQ